MNYWVWIRPLEHDKAVVYWVAEDGANGDCVTVKAEAAAELASGFIRDLESQDRDNVVIYTESPTPETLKAWAVFQDQQNKVAQTTTPDQLKVLRDQNHLCPACIVYDVCAVGQATKQAEALLTSVNACLGFQPHGDER